MKGAIWRGGSLAVFFFVIYAGYALGKLPELLASGTYTHDDQPSILVRRSSTTDGVSHFYSVRSRVVLMRGCQAMPEMSLTSSTRSSSVHSRWRCLLRRCKVSRFESHLYNTA